MEIIPDKRKVVGLVDSAYGGRLCLPEFQRDFVWTRDQVADLVRSILRRYFIGSLLLLRCDPDNPPFAPIFLRGARPGITTPRPELLILDGQQRITALLYALTAPDLPLRDSSQRRWFFVDLQLLLEDAYDDQIVFDRSKKELDGLDEPEVQFKRSILPCTTLLKSSDFLKWRDGLDDWLRERDASSHKHFREKWRDPWTEAANEFQAFQVPLVYLSMVADGDSDSFGRVCAIFEKLNSTGEELSIYDLLTARLYRSGIKLHDLWDQACKEYERLAYWSGGKAEKNKFGVLMLRTLALLRGLDPKPRILIDLEPAGFEKDWSRAAAAMDRALELVALVGPDGFGVFRDKWLPGFGLIPILAALRAEIETRKLGEGPRGDLRRWYWCNVFLERYSSSVESKSRKDYMEFLGHWTEGKPEPAVFAEARARIGAQGFSIRDSASYASAVYSGVFCLLALKGARDWALKENIQLQKLQDHHVFPQGYLKKAGITKQGDINSIINRTLISDETNNKIKDKAPAAYLADPAIFAAGPTMALMSPHFLSRDAVGWMGLATGDLHPGDAAEVYQEFLKAREAEMVAEIRRACGVSAGV